MPSTIPTDPRTRKSTSRVCPTPLQGAGPARRTTPARSRAHAPPRSTRRRGGDMAVNANQELWEKGDFTQIAATMRDSGEELVKELGITNGMHVLDLGGGDGTTALPAARLGADVLVIDIARNLVEAGYPARRGSGSGQRPLRAGRRQPPRRGARRLVRPRRHHLRGDVRTRPVRGGGGDGAGDQAGWTDRHGQLDPGRPDAGGPDPEDQRVVRPAAAPGVRQPGDLGCGGARGGAVRRRRRADRRGSRASAPPTRSTTRGRRASSSKCSARTTARR